MLGVYTILQVGEQGWGSAQTLGLGAVSVALLAAFVARQARVANPLMPLRLFHSRNVSGANVVIALLVVGMFGMFFLGALYLQRIEGYDPLQVGLAFLPSTVVMGTMSLRVSGPLVMRFGAKATLIASLVSIGVGLVLFSLTPVDATYVTQIMPATILIGLGAGLGFPSLMMLAMSGATPEDSGLASGLINTSVQVGGADRAGGARHARDRAHEHPARRRRVDQRRAQRGLPPGLPDRRRARGRRHRGRRDRAALGQPGGGAPARRAHATRSRRTPTRPEYDRQRARSPVLHRLRRGQRADRLRSDGPAGRLRARPAGHGAEGVRRAAGRARAPRRPRRRHAGRPPISRRCSARSRRSTASPGRWPSASTRSRCTCATPTTATPRASGPRPPTETPCAPTWPRCPASAR